MYELKRFALFFESRKNRKCGKQSERAKIVQLGVFFSNKAATEITRCCITTTFSGLKTKCIKIPKIMLSLNENYEMLH